MNSPMNSRILSPSLFTATQKKILIVTFLGPREGSKATTTLPLGPVSQKEMEMEKIKLPKQLSAHFSVSPYDSLYVSRSFFGAESGGPMMVACQLNISRIIRIASKTKGKK